MYCMVIVMFCSCVGIEKRVMLNMLHLTLRRSPLLMYCLIVSLGEYILVY